MPDNPVSTRMTAREWLDWLTRELEREGPDRRIRVGAFRGQAKVQVERPDGSLIYLDLEEHMQGEWHDDA